MAFMKACTLDDLWQGDMDVFEIDGTEVLLVHTDTGQIHAVQAICPHQEVHLVDGELEGKVLTCCMHLWQLDDSNGNGINPTHDELAKYPVRIDGHAIQVDVVGVDPKFAHA